MGCFMYPSSPWPYKQSPIIRCRDADRNNTSLLLSGRRGSLRNCAARRKGFTGRVGQDHPRGLYIANYLVGGLTDNSVGSHSNTRFAPLILCFTLSGGQDHQGRLLAAERIHSLRQILSLLQDRRHAQEHVRISLLTIAACESGALPCIACNYYFFAGSPSTIWRVTLSNRPPNLRIRSRGQPSEIIWETWSTSSRPWSSR